MTRGKFITLEGGEGAGKSTQIKLLAHFLRDKGLTVVETREVGGSPGAEEIRKLWLSKDEGYWDPLTELLLITAARRDHLVKTIWPALEQGHWVISDRFFDSTSAYQGLGLKLGLSTVDQLYKLIADQFRPDATLLLDIPVEIGLARIRKRGETDDRYEQQDHHFHNLLRQSYQYLAETYPERITMIDATSGSQEIAHQIQGFIQRIL